MNFMSGVFSSKTLLPIKDFSPALVPGPFSGRGKTEPWNRTSKQASADDRFEQDNQINGEFRA